MNKIYIPLETLQETLAQILLKHGFTSEKAVKCAAVFVQNSLEGVYSHGVNRFPRFVRYIRKGYIDVNAAPSLVNAVGAAEQWNGNLGPGPLNATLATERAMQLAEANGIGMVTLAHTNHWMRGGTYGWQAARRGFVFLGWTNTEANMPAWGGKNKKTGNNPLVFAVPFGEEAIVLDMALSQFSFGTMENSALEGKKLSVPGGFDCNGQLTDSPSEILTSRRPLPVGYWKGSGLSLLLDILAAILSGGKSTSEVSKHPDEVGVSQVFIAISLQKLHNFPAIQHTITGIINDFLHSEPAGNGFPVRYPGQRVVETRRENQAQGIPVNRKVWEEITSL